MSATCNFALISAILSLTGLLALSTAAASLSGAIGSGRAIATGSESQVSTVHFRRHHRRHRRHHRHFRRYGGHGFGYGFAPFITLSFGGRHHGHHGHH